jgi:hypothetical protein
MPGLRMKCTYLLLDSDMNMGDRMRWQYGHKELPGRVNAYGKRLGAVSQAAGLR